MRCVVALLLSSAFVPTSPLAAADKPEVAAAVAKIKALGGRIERGKGLWSRLGLTKPANDDEGTVVGVILIGKRKFKAEDLKCLQSLPDLQGLWLGRSAITDAGLKHAAGLKKLNVVGLIGTGITDAGLKELSGLPQLRNLFLSSTAITDAGLSEIAKITSLRELLLDSNQISDAGLVHLEKLRNLVELDLSATKITDAGLKSIARLPNLMALDLSQTAVTDAGLNQLRGLKKLTVLRVVETKITDAGVKQLQDTLPQARIARRAGGGGQRTDPNFDVSVPHPAYTDTHPTVLFDEAHQNFHTASGRYKCFADLITNDGYRVTPNTEPFTAERLAKYNILITANAPAASGPSPSAFTKEECDAVEHWVRGGGSLLIVTDHEPFGSGSAELGKRFGVDMSLRVTIDPANETSNGLLFSRAKNQLGDHVILNGRHESERVNRVLTFTGQSLKGPPGSANLLKFSDTAVDVDDEKRISAAGRAQGIAFKFGEGRVVVMGEAAELSAQVYGDPPIPMGMNVPGSDNRKLALNIVHWLSGLIN